MTHFLSFLYNNLSQEQQIILSKTCSPESHLKASYYHQQTAVVSTWRVGSVVWTSVLSNWDAGEGKKKDKCWISNAWQNCVLPATFHFTLWKEHDALTGEAAVLFFFYPRFNRRLDEEVCKSAMEKKGNYFNTQKLFVLLLTVTLFPSHQVTSTTAIWTTTSSSWQGFRGSPCSCSSSSLSSMTSKRSGQDTRGTGLCLLDTCEKCLHIFNTGGKRASVNAATHSTSRKNKQK